MLLNTIRTNYCTITKRSKLIQSISSKTLQQNKMYINTTYKVHWQQAVDITSDYNRVINSINVSIKS